MRLRSLWRERAQPRCCFPRVHTNSGAKHSPGASLIGFWNQRSLCLFSDGQKKQNKKHNIPLNPQRRREAERASVSDAFYKQSRTSFADHKWQHWRSEEGNGPPRGRNTEANRKLRVAKMPHLQVGNIWNPNQKRDNTYTCRETNTTQKAN